MKGFPLKTLFIIHVRGKKYQSNKNDQDLGLLKIWPKFGHSKVHSYLFVKFFVVVFFNSYLFFHHVSYIESLLKNIEMKS